MSKVSIIVPVYNGEKVIRRCVDSILAQDYRDIEIILVDDGSKDDSFKIIEEYAARDERIVPVHKENGGVSSTRNRGLDIATGQYVQFMDVDDWLPFDSVKLLVRAMEENDVGMVIGDFYRVVGDKTSKKGSISKGGTITRNKYADKMMLSPSDFYYGVLWNKLYRKDIIDRHHIRMDENISYCEDVIFNLEYLLHVRKIHVLKAPVYYYVLTEGSLVQQNMNIQNTVKMKLSVIKYYSDFYKNILNEEDYETRKPIIYSYLVAFSTDAFVLPFSAGTKKLGEENGEKTYYPEVLGGSIFLYNYLSDALISRLLKSLAEQKKMEITDIRIVYYLYKNGTRSSLEEISSILNIPMPSCVLSLTKLMAMSYVKISKIDLFEREKVFYEYADGSFEELHSIDEDYLSIAQSSIPEEDLQTYYRVLREMEDNLKKTLISR